MRSWFDELSEQEKVEIHSIRESVGNPDRVLPLDHGTKGQQHLDFAERAFLAAKEPFYFIRLNDCEMGMLSGGYPLPGGLDLKFALFRTGFHRSTFFLRPEFLSAVEECPLLALNQLWTPFNRHTAIYLSMLGHKVPYERGVTTAIAYYILARGHFFNFVAGKKVVLIGTESEKLAQAWRGRDFIEAYSHLGPVDKAEIVDTIRTPNRGPEAHKCLDPIIERLKRTQFDVALLACGGLAKILSYRIWKMGRTALDMGAVFPALLGGTERQRLILRDIKWPVRTWSLQRDTK
jgi:hypothetical protein